MMVLPLSVHYEMSAKGAGVVVVELIFEVVLLIGTTDNDWSFTIDVDNKLIFLKGDDFSVSNFHVFVKSLVNKSSHAFYKTHKKGLMLRKDLSKVTSVIGY